MPSPLTIVASFVAKPGQERRLLEELTAMIEPSLAEEGCLAYHAYTDPSRADRVVLIEEWTGAEALEHHFTLPHFKHIAAVLDEILAEPFTMRRLTDAAA